MHEKYLPATAEGRLFHLIEECGEVLLAIGKARRFGMGNRFPADGPTNAEKLLGELRDLKSAVARVEPDIREDAKAAGRRPPSASNGRQS